MSNEPTVKELKKEAKKLLNTNDYEKIKKKIEGKSEKESKATLIKYINKAKLVITPDSPVKKSKSPKKAKKPKSKSKSKSPSPAKPKKAKKKSSSPSPVKKPKKEKKKSKSPSPVKKPKKEKKKSVSPVKKVSVDKSSDRYKELNRLNLKSKSGETNTVLAIAQKYNIPKRTSLNKGDLIMAIIEYENKHGRKESPVKKVSPPKKKPAPKAEEPKKVPKKASPPKKKTPSEETEEEETEEEEEKPKKATPIKTKKVSPPKAKKTPSEETEEEVENENSCGDWSRDELLNEKLSELQDILKSGGVKNPKSVTSKEEAIDLICHIANNGALCDDKYGCPDDGVCDASKSVPICVDESKVPADLQQFEYKGKKIAGNKKTLEQIKKELKIPSESPKKKKGILEAVVDALTPEFVKKSDLIKRIRKATGRAKSELEHLSVNDLEEILEGLNVEVKKVVTKVKPVVEKAKEKVKPVVEKVKTKVKEKVKKFKQELDPDERHNMIKVIVEFTGQDPRSYDDFPDREIRERYESILEEYNYGGEIFGPEIPKPKPKVPKVEKVKKPKTPSESEEETEEEKSSEDEAETAKERSKQDSVSSEEIEKILLQVKSGKGNIEEFTQVQNTVLKCLGLLSG